MDRVTILREAMRQALKHIRSQNYGKAAVTLETALVDDAEKHHSKIDSPEDRIERFYSQPSWRQY